MELQVRSLDKAYLSQVKELYVDSPNGRAWRIGNDTTVFGVYETKARCIEILDEIQQMIDDAPIFIKNAEQLDKDALERALSGNIRTVVYNDEVIPIKTLVYQMPEKQEIL